MNRAGNRRTTLVARRRAATPKLRRRAMAKTTARRPSKSSARASTRGATRAGARSSKGKMTTDPEFIRRWVEKRGGHPAIVKRSLNGRQGGGILRIDFPGFSGERTLKPVSWDKWFDVFRQRRLAFLYQERTAGGKPSRFNKLVCRS